MIYALTIVASVFGESWAYYFVLSAIETALVMLLVWYAWTWRRAAV